MADTIEPATFKIKVVDIKTTTVGELTNVVKEVNYTITATKDGITTPERQFTATLGDPTVEGYIPFTDLSEDKVIEFILNNDKSINAIKTFLERQLDLEILTNKLSSTPLPWSIPVNEPTSSAINTMEIKVPEANSTEIPKEIIAAALINLPVSPTLPPLLIPPLA